MFPLVSRCTITAACYIASIIIAKYFNCILQSRMYEWNSCATQVRERDIFQLYRNQTLDPVVVLALCFLRYKRWKLSNMELWWNYHSASLKLHQKAKQLFPGIFVHMVGWLISDVDEIVKPLYFEVINEIWFLHFFEYIFYETNFIIT